MNKITDISHSFRARDQFYRLLTVRFAFQILNAKDQSNQDEAPLWSPKIWLPMAAVFLLAANLSLIAAYHALVHLTERSLTSLVAKANAKSLIRHKPRLQKVESAKQCPWPAKQPRGSYPVQLARQGSACFPNARTRLSERESLPAPAITR